jgi:D-alanyl-D-alanine carboxypeptidase
MMKRGAGGVARRMWALAWAAALVLACGGSAVAGYSSIVIDADSGKVLAQHAPDAQNYPASLTKMMTLFLTFKGLEGGTLKLDQRFAVSAHAAAQAPSKLDLKPGDSVALKDLIFALITHSANDAAVVLAENIAGSEPAFVERMNRAAKALGMTHSHFANPNGLPNPDNVSTARDLAALALALYRDFPKEYPWFSTEDYSFRGVNYANHNHLMHSFDGMDGIKTGYIRASGFNLAASAVRNGRRLVAVVMGGESAHSRDMKMASLLDAAFARKDETQIAQDAAPGDGGDTLAHRAGRALAALSPVSKAEAATHGIVRAHVREHHPQLAEAWQIQVGSYIRHDMAEHAAELALQRISAAKGHPVMVVAPARAAKDHVFRARLAHFTHREAEAACRTLHRKHHGCAVIAPDAAQMATK